jgi:hypothetical protein
MQYLDRSADLRDWTGVPSDVDNQILHGNWTKWGHAVILAAPKTAGRSPTPGHNKVVNYRRS